MENNSRRKFLKGMALTGIASVCLPTFESFAINSSVSKLKVKTGMVILFQGDSITDGNRGRNTDPNHILGHGYQFSIGSRLAAEYPEKRMIFYNRGISGNNINSLTTRWQTDTLDLKPDLLSILIGINDASSAVFQFGPKITVEEYEEKYKSLLEQTREKFPNIVFVLCEPFILPVGKVKDNWDAYHTDILKRQVVVRKLAEQFNAVFVGFQKVFDKAIEKAPADYWIWDGIHPTIAGHELMALEWMKQVEKRIKF